MRVRTNRTSRSGDWLAVVLVAGLVACASPPASDPASVTPIQPSPMEQVGIDSVLYVLDASSSMGFRSGLEAERRLLASLAAAMPRGLK